MIKRSLVLERLPLNLKRLALKLKRLPMELKWLPLKLKRLFPELAPLPHAGRSFRDISTGRQNRPCTANIFPSADMILSPDILCSAGMIISGILCSAGMLPCRLK